MIVRQILHRCAALLFAAVSAQAMADASRAAPASGQTALYLDAINSLADGRTDDASVALTRMIEQEPQHAGAWLDLAIIQCEMGHAEEAERLFRAIEQRFSPPAGIMEVIAIHRATGCKGWQPQSQLNVALARGFDNNVNQGATSPNFSIGSGTSRIDLELLPEYRPKHDQYTLLSADYARDLMQDGTSGFAQLRVRHNDSLSNYNTASLLFGLEHLWRPGNWELHGIGAIGLLTLGNRLYQRQDQLQLRVAPPLKLPQQWHLNLTAGMTHIEYPTLANFDSNTFEFSGLLGYRAGESQTQAGAGYLADQGEAKRLGGNRKGWFASVQERMPIGSRVIGEFGWTRQIWLSQSAYSPGLIDQVRRQDTQLVRAALTIPIKPRQSVQIELRQVRNDENISIFQYNSRLLQVGWQWQPF
jgi:hypothetical protein